MDELDFYDPELELVELGAPKRRRRRKKNPEPAIVATPILLLGLAYAGWILFNKSKFGTWNFAPWKLAGLTKPRLQLRQTNNAQAEEEKRRASLHEAIEQMMKPSVITVDTEMPWRRPRYDGLEKETVSFIYP